MSVKSLNGLAIASVKSRNGLAIASVKSVNGLSVSSIDSDAQAYFDRITAAGSSIDSTAQTAINNFVVGCKADSIWTLLLDIGPLCGSDLTAALIKLKKLNPLSDAWSYGNPGGTPFTGGDYSQATGLTGTGNSYLNSSVSGDTLTLNSLGIGVYNRSSANGVICLNGAREGAGASPRLTVESPSSDDILYADICSSATELPGSLVSGPVGFVFDTRPSSSELSIYRNGSLDATTSTTGGALPTLELYWFARNNNGTASNYTTHTLAFLAITSGMNSTQAAAFNTRVQALQTSLGRNV